MSKIEWDRKTGGVILKRYITPDTLSVSPRPVFYEELDLLHLTDFGWKYPKVQEPLLWACNKQYYYRGDFVFEVKGANVYDAPTVVFAQGFEKMNLKPVNVNAMLEKNNDQMFLLENKAIEFIREQYLKYANANNTRKASKANQLDFEQLVAIAEKKMKKKMAIVKEDCDSFDIMPLDQAEAEGKRVYQTTKIDKFLASFSGGKDSQVVLDLCVRSIPPQDFEVIYSDTGYELPPSLELYKTIEQHYKGLYPELSFRTARNHASVLSYWDKIGTPSDTHRWCCTVMKTAPLYRMLKKEDNKQAHVLTFDGVRSEESTRRSRYSQIGKGVKHSTVINASPILEWNTVEVFLYLFKHNLPINIAYRQGMTRVGCLICPFSSEWNDMVSHHCYNEKLAPFLDRIEKSVKSSGINDVNEYIKMGNWKRRAGSRELAFPSFMQIKEKKPHLTFNLTKPQKSSLTWLEAVGHYQLSENSNGKITGELQFEKQIYKFELLETGEDASLTFFYTQENPTLQGLLKRVFYKSTYCIDCCACEVECPTGALTILPRPTINASKCIHCHKCLLFHMHGCISAASLSETGIQGSEIKSNNMKLTSYNNFGMNGGWVDFFLSNIDTYFDDNSHGLHVKEQLPNFVKWLVQAGILDNTKNKQITKLGKQLAELYLDSPETVWQIIWINLCYDSPIAKWYKEKIEWGREFTQSDIEELLHVDYPELGMKTIHNILYALFRTFRESPIGSMGQLEPISKQKFRKISSVELTKSAVVYSLYKYSESRNVKSLRVKDLFIPENPYGIYKEFGISKGEFESLLRSLNSDVNRLLIAELNMGLDNITLRDDIKSDDVLDLVK